MKIYGTVYRLPRSNHLDRRRNVHARKGEKEEEEKDSRRGRGAAQLFFRRIVVAFYVEFV